MILVAAAAGAIWGTGAWMGTQRSARWLLLGLLYVAVLAVQVALPPGAALKEATGGSAALWVLIGAAGAVALAYRAVLVRLRARARPLEVEPDPAAPPPGGLGEAQVERYARHIVLREIGGPGQRALSQARVLVVGAGGLGAPALLYLAGAGVGTIGVIDPDRVEAGNLQRQVIHRDADIGTPKVASAQRAIRALNPYVAVCPYDRRFEPGIANALVAEYDLVLDGTDDWATRALVNRACAAAGVPLVWGAIAQWDGQVTVFDPARGAPCHACLFPREPAPGTAPSCAEGGVAGPLPGIVGAAMAMEAVKEITGAGETLRGRLLLWDGLHAAARTIHVARDPSCAVCGSGARSRGRVAGGQGLDRRRGDGRGADG